MMKPSPNCLIILLNLLLFKESAVQATDPTIDPLDDAEVVGDPNIVFLSSAPTASPSESPFDPTTVNCADLLHNKIFEMKVIGSSGRYVRMEKVNKGLVVSTDSQTSDDKFKWKFFRQNDSAPRSVKIKNEKRGKWMDFASDYSGKIMGTDTSFPWTLHPRNAECTRFTMDMWIGLLNGGRAHYRLVYDSGTKDIVGSTTVNRGTVFELQEVISAPAVVDPDDLSSDGHSSFCSLYITLLIGVSAILLQWLA